MFMPLFKKNENLVYREKKLDKILSNYVRYIEDNIANINVIDPEMDLQEVEDAIEMLVKQTTPIPYEVDITVLIEFKYKKHNNEPSVEKVQSIISKNLVPRILSVTNEIKRISTISLILFTVGFAMLIASILISENGFSSLAIQQVFSIFSWVFVWTSLEKMIFERIELVRRKQLLKRLYFADYELDPKSILKKSTKISE
jgi:hypothetical protein